MHPRPAYSVTATQLGLDGFARAVVRGPSHPTLAALPNMGYNKTPYEAEILA